MRHPMLVRLAGLVGPVVLCACQLSAGSPTPTLAPTATASPLPSATATASPTATITLTPTSTATPTWTPTATTTFTPSPTDTATPTPDPLAGAILKLGDLPDGFVELSAADRDRLGFSDEKLAASFAKSFTSAQLHNASGFSYARGSNFQIVLAYMLYPLSPLEQATLDLSLSDPTLFQKAFVLGAGQASGAAGATTTAKTLAGMNKFGDKSAGVAAVLTTAAGLKLHLDIVVVRRGHVFEVYNSIYPDKIKPPAALADMVKALDGRVAAVVP